MKGFENPAKILPPSPLVPDPESNPSGTVTGSSVTLYLSEEATSLSLLTKDPAHSQPYWLRRAERLTQEYLEKETLVSDFC